jgi:cell division FtsZ-interacting protein ZapD
MFASILAAEANKMASAVHDSQAILLLRSRFPPGCCSCYIPASLCLQHNHPSVGNELFGSCTVWRTGAGLQVRDALLLQLYAALVRNSTDAQAVTETLAPGAAARACFSNKDLISVQDPGSGASCVLQACL